MKWRIVEQTEKEETVLIKQVKFAPVENKVTGEVSFMPLRMTIFKVIVSDGKEEHKITWNAKSGRYIWTWPSKMQHPFLKDGHKIMRSQFGREYLDTLAPMVEVKGQQEKCDTVEEFAKLLVRMVGNQLASEIMGLFITAIMSKAA